MRFADKWSNKQYNAQLSALFKYQDYPSIPISRLLLTPNYININNDIEYYAHRMRYGFLFARWFDGFKKIRGLERYFFRNRFLCCSEPKTCMLLIEEVYNYNTTAIAGAINKWIHRDRWSVSFFINGNNEIINHVYDLMLRSIRNHIY